MRLSRLIALLAAILVSNCSVQAGEPPRIGDRIGKLKFTDIRSLPRTIDDFGAKKAYVFVFINTSCPVAQRYLPTLQSLEKEYRGKRVQFVAVNAAEEDTLIDMATQAVRYAVEFPFVKDLTGDCARTLGVTRTPEVAVLDAARTLSYRGRIDDQHRLSGNRKAPTSHDLKDAIDAVLAGTRIANPETEVDGCRITRAKPRKPKVVNYAEHIAPLLAKHCWECHRDGTSAPFSLTSYKQARPCGPIHLQRR